MKENIAVFLKFAIYLSIVIDIAVGLFLLTVHQNIKSEHFIKIPAILGAFTIGLILLYRFCVDFIW